jgi:hypothetical protein
MCPELGDPRYTAQMKHSWPSQPASMIVVEYHGYGDPACGGSADDRVLGECGSILPRAPNRPAAVFATIEEAAEAAQAIPNRRSGSSLGVVPRW